ncbi:MAG: sporulation transcriptional regulator SpoIIID [Clostridiales bacterium]|nr:sporulation transcriptional regulator SpoIIID [Clostridiales bacterium]
MTYIEERIYQAAHYIIDHDATVRDAAKALKSSKSTVHQDVTARLAHLRPALARRVRKVLDKNKAERHIRGGNATHEKYKCVGRTSQGDSQGVATP